MGEYGLFMPTATWLYCAFVLCRYFAVFSTYSNYDVKEVLRSMIVMFVEGSRGVEVGFIHMDIDLRGVGIEGKLGDRGEVCRPRLRWPLDKSVRCTRSKKFPGR